jgi:hypothetical protein
MGSADVESSDYHGRTPHYDHLEQLIPSVPIDPVNLSVCPGKLWFRPDISRYPIKDQAFVKVNIYEFSFRTRTGDDATHEVENDEGDEEEDDRDGGCPSQPGDLAE